MVLLKQKSYSETWGERPPIGVSNEGLSTQVVSCHRCGKLLQINLQKNLIVLNYFIRTSKGALVVSACHAVHLSVCQSELSVKRLCCPAHCGCPDAHMFTTITQWLVLIVMIGLKDIACDYQSPWSINQSTKWNTAVPPWW